MGEAPTQSTQPSAVFFHEAFASPGAYPASSELFALKSWRTETTVFPLTTTPASSPGPLSLRSRRAAVPGIFGAYLRAARVGAGAVSVVDAPAPDGDVGFGVWPQAPRAMRRPANAADVRANGLRVILILLPGGPCEPTSLLFHGLQQIANRISGDGSPNGMRRPLGGTRSPGMRAGNQVSQGHSAACRPMSARTSAGRCSIGHCPAAAHPITG